MDRGTYIAASGAFAQMRKLEIVNNNLANLNTAGFKKEILVGKEQSFDETLASVVAANDPYAKGDHDRTPGVVDLQSKTDFSPGPIKETGNKLDLALRNPNDFLVVSTASGPRYTRAGNLTLNENNELATQDGVAVSGEGGPITVPPGALSISANGVVFSNGIQAGKLQVVRFEDPSTLRREGGARFFQPPAAAAPTAVEPELINESLEMANISVINSMLDLVSVSRTFDMYTKATQSVDQLNQVAISQVGRRN